MRFRKSIKLAPGIRMNLSGGGISWTLGPKGASIGIGKRGTYLNTGIPGSGLYSRERIGGGGAPPHSAAKTTTTVSATVSINDEGVLTFKDAAGNPLSDTYIELLKKQQGATVHDLIQRKCDEINGQIEALGEIHHYTPDPRLPLEFFPAIYEVPRPPPPQLKRPGLLAKLFRRFAERVAAQNEKLQGDYEQSLRIWTEAKSVFDRNEDERRRLLASVRAGDPEAMEDFLGAVLADIVWPRETQVSFEVREGARQVWLNVDLPEIADMPSKTASVPQRGFRLSVKEMGPTWVQKLYMRHVHSIGFRLIGEAFAMLPTVTEVVLSAYSQRPNSATGQVGDEYLYSVRVHRPDWEAINFGNLVAIDVVEAFSRFDLRRTMTKTGVFKPVDPFGNP